MPQTPTGRWAAVVIMITGIAVLGLLAGALASFFRLDENHAGTGSPADAPASAAATASDTALQAPAAEVAALRRQVEALTQRLTGTPPDQASEEPPRGEDAVAVPLHVAGSHSASRWGQSRR